MKKFIRGTLELDKNVTDLVAYEENKKIAIMAILDWCDRVDIGINCGTAEDNTYLCEYKIVANTKRMCIGLLSELKEMLKDVFPYCKSLWQGSGDVLR